MAKKASAGSGKTGTNKAAKKTSQRHATAASAGPRVAMPTTSLPGAIKPKGASGQSVKPGRLTMPNLKKPGASQS